jgi:hypothetical protein
MTDFAPSMGASADWMSDRLRRQIAALDAQEQAAAVREERDREAKRETAHERALQAYKVMADARGEDVTAMDLAMGFGGRTMAEVIDHARAQSDREDAAEAAREARQGQARVPIFVGEPQIVEAVSPQKRQLLNRSRRWREYQDRRRSADAAKAAMEDEFRIPLRSPVVLPDTDPLVDMLVPRRGRLTARSQATAQLTAEDRPVSFR